MKKLAKSFTNLSLLQQISVMAATVAIALVVFFSVYLRGSISDFVTNQTMSLLETSQRTIVMSVESGTIGNSEIGYDSQILHFLFYRGDFAAAFTPMQFSPTLLEQAQKQAGSLQTEWEQGRMEADGIGYYYRTQRIDNNRVVISLINESYAVNIENQLLRGIANTCAIVVSIAFVLILLWALSIIAPLQQIRVYIDKVRKGEEAQLHIDRGDEIGEMANEIVSLREELKHQEDTKEEMIHNISHDLKTPIATIKSYAQSIKDGIYPYDTLEKSVDVIINNADRLEKKVYSLLFLNRLDYMMDQARETDKTTDMAATIDTVVRSLKAIRPQIELVRDLQPAVFRGDEESWRIVVENLLENALRYAEKQIVITLREGELSVWNDGPALSQERMERLFKPFEKGTKGKFGLGLSICYKVCQAYGYNIDAENLEKGVIFRITVKEEAPRKEKKKGGKR